jgi:hypothetical protein
MRTVKTVFSTGSVFLRGCAARVGFPDPSFFLKTNCRMQALLHCSWVPRPGAPRRGGGQFPAFLRFFRSQDGRSAKARPRAPGPTSNTTGRNTAIASASAEHRKRVGFSGAGCPRRSFRRRKRGPVPRSCRPGAGLGSGGRVGDWIPRGLPRSRPFPVSTDRVQWISFLTIAVFETSWQIPNDPD